ncbi:pyridoxine biosynthesis protein [Orbilia oligospora]|uniref:Pyridoxine biosynthesis protein n=1 Tax=Orbilia oligospora TaxID=2813651 RepID=A0A7C8TWD4_ORBOL|nr:pyridoxine biosynthesis protein [Orbilia oligospora]KAF3180604.1 pyridoxine biosynthesis protein [Orbilia oligospora]KAF3261873.1 pyridoxine biosynthesis protein [Orbilia oligospora]KAF3265923.1 pyridoxine biosynthesis protein [Orbilia oligospora]KAF3290347.1 pyridoxine biosynthesis protein [Orbilia oligospora]
MTSTMSSALRSSKRLLRPGYSWRAVAARGISSTTRDLKAHNFNMPALSPTMMEGTITSWRINEGDKFAAGDVILEVETDKAQMDVEAQDDGILAKIFVKASKDAVQVGTRIGVLADIEDDISTLEIPPESPSIIPQESSSPPPPSPSKQESTPSSSSSSSSSSQDQSQPQESTPTPHKPRKNPFIPTPGLVHLLHTNGLQMSDINGTGPQGRVLKGDVLAHLGKIDKNKPKSLARDISKLSKLDLSNVTPKKQSLPPKKPEDQQQKQTKKPNPLEEIEVSIPISLAKLNTTQIPVETTIAKAVELANSGLPPSKIPATPGELFDEILGLPSIKREPKYSVKTSEFKPVPQTPVVADLFDEIIGISKPRSVSSSPSPSPGLQEFKVKVPAIDRDRAEFFLAKVKFSLEQDEKVL